MGKPDEPTQVPFREIHDTYAMYCQEMRRRAPGQPLPSLTEYARDVFPAIKKALDENRRARPRLTLV